MTSALVGARVGIVGGGQLGRMLILEGKPLGIRFGVLSPRADDPASELADVYVQGELSDASAILRLAEWADVITIEIEHVSIEGLRLAAANRVPAHPAADVLDRINDKLVQKRVLFDAGVPVGPFSESFERFPVVQKSRHGGYDGRGVAVLRNESSARLPGATYYETPVDIASELAVVVARSAQGEERTFPVVEMQFDPDANICTHVLSPARVDTTIEERSQAIAIGAARALDIVGLLAVELFLTRDGSLLVNEVAPRPHNSGHLTIDCCETSQFEQHLRAILGAPLGSTRSHSAGVMRNLLGASDAIGTPRLPNVEKLLSQPGCHLHWYGKHSVKPTRKMGHVTVTAPTLELAISACDGLESALIVESEDHGAEQEA